MKSILIRFMLLLSFGGIVTGQAFAQSDEVFPQVGSFYILRSTDQDVNGRTVKILRLSATDSQWAKVIDEDNTAKPPRLETKWISIRSLSGAQQTGMPADWPRPPETHPWVKKPVADAAPSMAPAHPAAPAPLLSSDYYVDGNGNEYMPGSQPPGARLVHRTWPKN